MRRMAEIVSFADGLRARRQARERQRTEQCIRIVEANIRLTLHLFASGPAVERPIRVRQLRQLSELLEYMVER
jgi:hypothetical protein